MKNSARTCYIVAIGLVLLGALACKKHPETVAITNPVAIPARATTLVMTPYFTNNKIKRYAQHSTNSCLITCIYMLVHSMRGEKAFVNEDDAEYKFDGSKSAGRLDEAQLAKKNQLKYYHVLIENSNSLALSQTTDSNYMYTDFEDTVNVIADILAIGPFVLGIDGHAILVIGIEKKDGTLIYINPLDRPELNKYYCCSIFYPAFLGISEIYYPNSYIPNPVKHHIPTNVEEDNFKNLKTEGKTIGPKDYVF